MGQAFIALWNDIRPEREAEYDQWHTQEHVPERVAVQGFLGARRYVNRQRDHHRYFTLYDVAELKVFESTEYVDLLNNPTPWSTSMRPDFRNFLRATCRVMESRGMGIGGALAMQCFQNAEVDASDVTTALARTLASPRVTAVHLGSVERGLPSVPWTKTPAASAPVRDFDRVLLIETLDRVAAETALAQLGAALALPPVSVDSGADVYDLAFVFPGADAGERLRHRRAHWDRSIASNQGMS
jgi:hypothetical protein